MNSFAPGPSRRLESEHLRSLLVHVDAEEVSLRNAMKLLQEIPLHALDELTQRQCRLRIEQSLQHTALLAENRIRVTTALGTFLGMSPDSVSFLALLPYATPAAATLLVAARQRLRRLVRQVQALSGSVAWIISESRRIQLTILESLPDGASSDRYDAAGQRQLHPASLRFETRS